MRVVLVCVLVSCVVGCDLDFPDSTFCDREVGLTGAIGGVEVGADDYSVQSTFFNRSLEEVALGEIDKEIMDELGLDANDPADVDRYWFWNKEYDYRFLFIEQLDEKNEARVPRIGRDFGVYFFGLATHGGQPDVDYEVFDLSGVDAARKSGDQNAIRDAVRAAIDEMRDNEKVDVVVVFAPDRSEEPAQRSVFINQFASAAHYATAGTMKFTGLLDRAGTPITELTYPVSAFDSGGVLGAATFGAANVGVDVKCVVTTLSGE